MVHCPLLVPPAPLVEASDAVITEAEPSLPPLNRLAWILWSDEELFIVPFSYIRSLS
eukprot:m.543630 g.543630  ORF g.543630 m.543630 type:complete len:57 (-) comp57667_c0_seq67:134-304(-)